MAEVVGIIASGVGIATLATQVLKSVLKLKELWDGIKEAPGEIFDLIEEAEILSGILLSLKDNSQFNNLPYLGLEQKKLRDNSLVYCQAGSQKLLSLIEEIASDLGKSSGFKRKVVLAKVVLKKDQFKRYKSRLKSAVRLLSLSEHCLSRAYQQHIYTLLTVGPTYGSKTKEVLVTAQTNPCRSFSPTIKKQARIYSTAQQTYWSTSWVKYLCGEVTGTNYYTISDTGAQDHNRQRRNNIAERHFNFRYHLPGWLANKVWEFCNIIAQGNWTTNLRVYNIIPNDALIFDFVQHGNVEGVQTLLSRNEASLYDRDEKGWTLLHYAVKAGDPTMCRLLINKGADINIGCFKENNTPLHYLAVDAEMMAFLYGMPIPELFRLLVLENDGDIYARTCEGIKPLLYFKGPAEVLSSLLRHHQVESSSSLLEDRIRIAAHIAYQSSRFEEAEAPEIVRKTLGDGWIGSPALNTPSYMGLSLLIIVFSRVVNCLSGIDYHIGIIPRFEFHNATMKIEENEWAKLLKDLIMGGAESRSYLNNDGHFILSHIWARINYHPLYGSTSPHDRMRMLLQIFYKAGIDLLEYGRTEAELLQSHQISRNFPGFHYRRHDKVLSWRLIKFEYGSLPSDWYFWMSEPSDKFAGDFWSMIENPPRNMPGAWAEENSDEDLSESDYYSMSEGGYYSTSDDDS